MNRIVVAKFGGSSLADANQFRKVKRIIESDKDRRFIVPSAPGKRDNKDYKITDLFYLCYEHTKNNIPFNQVFKIIQERYIKIVKELGINLDIETYLREIKQKISEGASKDYTASRGEYLNGLILASFLEFEFIDAAEIIRFDRYGYFDSEETQKLIEKKIKKLKNAVIPGFYGAKSNANIKTFSRGGSDISGAVVARGVHADLYENWTDVSGFLMADPGIVLNPKPIEEITYKELRELAYMGASVLHEESIFPAKKGGIPIYIKNTNAPEDKGTIIVNDYDLDYKDGTITGIAGRKNFTVIKVEKTFMNEEVGFGRRLLSALETYGVSFQHLPSGIDMMSVVIDDVEVENKLDKVLEEIKRQCNPDNITVIPDMALIAIVGIGMNKNIGAAAKIFTVLAEEGIKVSMIDQGASGINIIVGVHISDFEKAIKAIYNTFKNN